MFIFRWILNYKQQSLKHHDDYVFIESSISGTSSVVVQVFYEQLAHQEKAKLALINAACWIVDNICLISHQVNEGASIDECKKLFFANAAIKTDCYNYNYGNQCVLKNVWKLALAIEPKYLPKRFEKV